jgi:tetratricopeptide (TPR) repeat protein
VIMATSFGILHLTDLHYGLASQELLFPNVRRIFFDDLKQLHRQCGPWDLVLFSGDLVQRGDSDEFLQLEKLLEELWRHFRQLNGAGVREPVLLAVPGNHDLQRLPAASAELRVLKALASGSDDNPEEVWDGLIEEPLSPYRKLVVQAFTNYSAWWDRCQFRGERRADLQISSGPLPGDFLATFQKDDACLGVVGLNTTFLQLTAGDFTNKLAIDARQFHGRYPGGGDAWIKNLDGCVLMTHQPPSWLAEINRKEVFNALIDVPGRFAAHYCGHLHLPKGETRGDGWSHSRRLIQGGSLFGLETRDGGDVRMHAYSASRIEINRGEEGQIRHWPRIAIQNQSGAWKFGRDQSFDLEDSDGGTRPERFPRLRATTRSDLFSSSPPIPDHTKGPPPKPMCQPDIGPLPTLDPGALFRRHFLGREDLLRDYEDALAGLFARAAGTPAPSRASEVQLMWFHGFGGMGKTWLLRQACVVAEKPPAAPQVVLIDWNLPEWHKPASSPPRDPREMFDAIAYRLTQLNGAEALDSYWQVRSEVESAWVRHCELHEQFEDAIIYLQQKGSGWRAANASADSPHATLAESGERSGDVVKHRRVLEREMRERRLWCDGDQDLAARLEDIRVHQHPFDLPDEGPQAGVFENWALEVTGSREAIAVQPCRVLCNSLQAVLRRLSPVRPLVLIFDTCELLPPVMDSWLRRLLGGPLDGKTPLLVLIGSRLRPDPYVEPGERIGWRQEIDAVRLRIVPFDEDVRFTVEQVAVALRMEQIPLPPDADLPVRLHRVTLGVPLAVGTLLELHRRGDLVLAELGAIDTTAGGAHDGASAARHVVEVVASRFLLHLEGRPEAAEDFRDIIALTLLRNADLQILGKFWNATWPANRLRALAQRYALLADGDLHPTVREFLRRHWRRNPPQHLLSLAMELHQVFRRVESPQRDLSTSRATWILNDLNLLGWSEGEQALPRFGRALVIFLAHNWDFSDLVELAKEIPALSPWAQSLQSAFVENARRCVFEVSKTSLQWLERQVTADWDTEERAYLDLLAGLTFARDEQHATAVQRFESGFERLASSVPRRDTFAQSYLNSVVALTDERQDIPLASRALVWVEKASIIEADVWNHEYYWLLHNAGRYVEAEAYCRRVITRDRSNLPARAFLGHIVGVHLDRPEGGEKEFRDGLEIDPTDRTLHFFLADLLTNQLQRFEEAESEYRKTLDGLLVRDDRRRVLCKLARLYSEHLNRLDAAGELLQEAVELSGKDADDELLNSAAWNFYLRSERLELAQEWAHTAVRKEPSNINVLHTLVAIQVRRDLWSHVVPNLCRWLCEVDREDFRTRWNDFHLTFLDTLKHGRGIEMADLILAQNDHPQWKVLESALRVAAGQRKDFAELHESLRPAAHQVLADIRAEFVTRPFPEVAD